ncbi:unnamed protein product [Fusarium graminearum]|uniref:Chromosome 4, complete genome n=1 Tax=Gibberella zeae (strain ATCC MYA-4620 / CBS 123657 / FGSC 9075 / NRRL 31084 / PH-1) TaxID=229533 RepID=A0A098DS30_GIBZE|nr:unnamed protein product [Fusarium graminearum]
MFAPGTIRTGFYKITPLWCVIHRRGSQPFLNCRSQLVMSCDVPIKESVGYDDSPDKSSESTQTGTEVAPISSRPLRTANSSAKDLTPLVFKDNTRNTTTDFERRRRIACKDAKPRPILVHHLLCLFTMSN